jgi:cytochrome P450
MSSMITLDRDINPFPFYRQMRAEQPVYFDRKTSHWNVFRYEDVQHVLSDHSTFSSQFAGSAEAGDSVFAASMISTDPPRHRQLRALSTQAFTPRAVEALAPRIQQIVDEYLDRLEGSVQMDGIADLGYPLPVIVIAEMMGIPSEDREKFKHWSDMIVSMSNMAGGSVDYDALDSSAIFEMSSYFFNLIELRRSQPQDDLISALLKAEVDGQKLEMMELLGFCSLLLVAGNETTTNLIGNALLTFAEHPEEWTRLRGNPDLLPQALEEVLRYRSPVQSMFRVAKENAEISGQSIPVGARLIAWIGSANHDDAQFLDADAYQIDRKNNKHLAFGQGIHYCLGAPLARLESKIALGEMLKRFSQISLKPDAPIERMPSTLIYGLHSLPLILHAG